ncbi:hypothetical protein [Sorangium sp. So ce1097]|uniref:hypothetical protein n=1 Tax=Sorangium sp. So ce1097 TaxID=3133330 RepID=UPI003F5D62E3
MPSNIDDAKVDAGVKVAFQSRYHAFVKAEQKFSSAHDSGTPPCVSVCAARAARGALAGGCCIYDLAACMGDTLPHLGSKADVERMFAGCARQLAPGGRLALTFRDLTRELEFVDRFIPVHDSADVIMTCFLEYEPETVKVHDLGHTRGPEDGRWRLSASDYRELRLSPDWVAGALEAAGLRVVHRELARGLVHPRGARRGGREPGYEQRLKYPGWRLMARARRRYVGMGG